MAEEQLDRLLERVRREGVEKAEQQAQALLSEARGQAEKIVQEARHQAAALEKKAAAEAEALRFRTEAALRQAARDVRLSVEQAVSKTLNGLVRLKTANAMTTGAGEWLPETIRAVVMAYAAQAGGETSGLAIAIPAKQGDKLKAALQGLFRDAIEKGLRIESDETLATGFKIKFTDRHVEHDFSGEAVSEAMSRLVHADVAQWLKDSPGKEAQ